MPGTVAAICLFLIILSSFSQELASWLEVIFLFTGLLIILIELFILPTFGLLGFVGVLMFLGGLLALMLPGITQAQYEFDTRTLNAAGEAMLERLVWLAATFVIGLITIALLARYVMPRFGAFQRFVLEGHEQTGYIASIDPALLPPVGSEGVAFSELRPSGKIEVNNKIYDAVTRGGYVAKGEEIKVVQLDGSVVVVQKK